MVYEGIINNKKLPQIRKAIIKEAKKSENKDIDYTLFAFGIRLARKSLKAPNPIEFLLENKNYNNSNKIINHINETIVANEKQEVIRDTIRDARKHDKIFYLCSKHEDCAEDHKDYQGKLYYDEKYDWSDPAINNVILNNQMQTFQWVTFRPVWMITRPNCRHYFKALKTEDVLTHSVGQLIRNHRMRHTEGKRVFQTIRYKTGEETLKAYEERLRYHEYLYAIRKTETLRKLIDKDKLLIKKWREYLKK